MIERWISARELAEVMGVSLRTVKRFTADGMPSETWGMGHTRRYRVSECVAWARARLEPVTAEGAPTPLGSIPDRRQAHG